jgi:hypothetical protein
MMALLDKDYGHLESRFTTTCQLVEGVHRKAFPVVDEELKKHEKFVQKLVNTMLEQGFTSREIKRIRGLLKHAYGPNLERRIVELERHAGGILSQIDGLDVHALAGGIAKLRNSFAHSTSEEVSNNARAIQVGLAATSIIVFGFMLTRMGIDQSSVLALMYRWRRCQQWIWLVQNHWQVLIES